MAQLQGELQQNPKDAKNLALLGLAYQQLARETGDPCYYTKSQGVLDQALVIVPNDLLATSGLGSLALARHQFQDALALGEKAKEISPTTARNYGVIGDALVELGRYRQGFDMFDRMAALKPGLAAYSRVSYARELLGDHEGAIGAMKLSLDAARGAKEPYAWTLWQLGKLSWAVGDARPGRVLLPAVPRRVSGVRLRARRARPGRGRAPAHRPRDRAWRAAPSRRFRFRSS